MCVCVCLCVLAYVHVCSISQLSNLRKQISLLQLQRHGGRHDSMTVDQKEALIAHCTKHFREGVRISATSPTIAAQYTDFYGLLAAHLMIELYGELGKQVWGWG